MFTPQLEECAGMENIEYDCYEDEIENMDYASVILKDINDYLAGDTWQLFGYICPLVLLALVWFLA